MPADAVDTHRHGRSVVRILLHDGSVRVLNTSELKKIVGEEEHVRFKQAVHKTCMWLLKNKRTADETEIDGKKKELEEIINNIMAGILSTGRSPSTLGVRRPPPTQCQAGAN